LNRSFNKIIVVTAGLLFCSHWVYAQNFALGAHPRTGGQNNTKTTSSAKTQTTAQSTQASDSTSNTTTQVVNKPSDPANFNIGDPAKDAASDGYRSDMRSKKRYAGSPNSKYTLGPSDVVEVIVARHPEVGGKYVLNSEGKVQIEFIGDVVLVGMTKEQATQFITKKLEKYIIKPEVTVKIVEYNSKVVYIVGEVGLPGKVFMRGDTITVREALLNAGLPQLTAATTSAQLFTPADDGRVETKTVNVYDLLYKGDLRQNYVMKPGDSLYMPPTLWAKIARFLNPVTQPLGQAAGAAASVSGF
jgi:polysaccharide biosynthesis/export protein